MGRRLRFLPYATTLVEVTNRTIHGRRLLKPTKKIREITLGAVGRAQRRYAVDIHAFVFLSNHYHVLASFTDVEQMARFAGYFQSKLAKEIARATGWRDKIWARRYTPIAVSNEPAAQVARLEYLLSQGIKERLVPHPAEWDGAQSVKALVEGTPLRGVWHDRTAEFHARKRGERVWPGEFEDVEIVELSPLPCWAMLTLEEHRERCRELVGKIVTEARKTRGPFRAALESLGPTEKPRHVKRSPAPWFHCASKAVRLELRTAYGEFLAAYREAAERVKVGELTAPFPEGCFPSSRPWVSGG